MTDLRPTPCVRLASPGDVPALLILCAAHARYERASVRPRSSPESMQHALFDAPARLAAWLAEADGKVIGYATATLEFSTWSCREFVHMDCLFVDEAHRGRGVGAELLQCVLDFACARGAAEVQWQTPEWNVDAARFYRRMGASASAKQRFVYMIGCGSADAEQPCPSTCDAPLSSADRYADRFLHPGATSRCAHHRS